MAFIQRRDNIGLVRDGFPHNIARNASEPDDWYEMSPTSYVPVGFEALFDWICVREVPSNTDFTRRFEVVHLPPSPRSSLAHQGNIRRLTVRVIGVVGNCKLAPLGNWNRSEKGCPKAIQFLTICPGPFNAQFEDQQLALQDIRNMVYRTLGEKTPLTRYRLNEMFFHRRVFKKLNDNIQPRNPQLPGGTDEERLQNISPRWEATGPVTCAKRLPDQSLKRCSQMLISPGDFVDITAIVDIVSIRKGSQEKRTDVHFAFNRIVRLLSAEELAKVAGVAKPAPEKLALPDIFEEKLPFEYEDIEGEETEGRVILGHCNEGGSRR